MSTSAVDAVEILLNALTEDEQQVTYERLRGGYCSSDLLALVVRSLTTRSCWQANTAVE